MEWLCEICGYIHEDDEPPMSCPVCGAPRSKFAEVKKQDNESLSDATDDGSDKDDK